MKEYRKFEMWLARMTAKTCRRLHLTSPSIASFQIDIDGEGIVKSKSNSWVRNMINIMACQGLMGVAPSGNISFFADGYLNLRNLAGTIENQTYGNLALRCSNDTGNEGNFNWGAGSSYGILVGSDNTAEDFSDYKLGNIIGHGNAAGQLYRNTQNMISKTWDSVNRKWVMTLQRSFINNSGSAVTVKELGYYTHTFGGIQTQYSEYQNLSSIIMQNGYMLIRDVLTNPITVNNGQTLTVTYNVEYAF